MTTQGYRLDEMVDQVRQVLHPSTYLMDTATLGNQGLTNSEMIERVRRAIADTNSELHVDNEITDWLNEAATLIAWRTRSVRVSVSGNTTAGGTLPVPAGYISWLDLVVSGEPVDYVDDDEWDDVTAMVATPKRLFARVAGANIEMFPPPNTQPYTMWYVTGRPTVLTGAGDQTNVPEVWNPHMIRYAQGHAFIKQGDVERGTALIQLFEQALPPGSDTISPGARGQEQANADRGQAVRDYDIIRSLNEGFTNLCARFDLVQRSVPLTVTVPTQGDTVGFITLPTDFLSIRELRAGTALADGSFVYDPVDLVAWNSYVDFGVTPGHGLAMLRPSGDDMSLAVYPNPGASALTLWYNATPDLLVNAGDRSEVATEWQVRAINYARYQQLLAQGDQRKAEYYFQLYERALPKENPLRKLAPGPFQITSAPNAFDRDPESLHLG